MTGVPATRRGAAVWPLLAGVAVLAGCTAAGIGALSVAAALTATGLPDPGPVTTLGLPFVRAAGEVAAVVAVGAFLLAAFLVPPQKSGVLDVDGYRAVRIGTVASGACADWAACPTDVFRRLRPADHRSPQPREALVAGQPDQYRDGVAADRGAGRGRD